MEVLSPTAGNVWKVESRLGDAVTPDTVLVIVEAMKMEIPIQPDVCGRVVAILVTEGLAVDEDQVVAVLETA